MVVRLVCLALAGVLVGCAAVSSQPARPDRSAPPAIPSEATSRDAAVTPAQATASSAPSVAPAPTATPAPKWDELPVAADDAAGLATQLNMVEAAIRDPNVNGAQLAWMGHLQQIIYGTLQESPEWKESVLAGLPEATRAAVNGSLEAGKQLRLIGGPIPRSLPDWKIVAPAPMEELLGYYREAEAELGVGWYYLASIHLVETRMGRIRGLSSAGAQGPMQFMPGTWEAYGKGDINKDHDAILGAARYLKAAGAPGNMQKALFAYNHSRAYVNALSLYADVLKADPAAYRGYHGWQVYYPTKDGPVLLPVGWTKE